MALKVSNKNRKKSVNDQITDAVTVKKVHQEQAEFTKKFTKYYIIAFVTLTILFFVI